MSRRLVFGTSSLLAFALVAFGCGSSGPSSPTSAADVTITITGVNGSMSYSPPSATMRVGQTVAWTNADVITHTATQDQGAFGTGSVSAGSASSPIRMSGAGTFSYHCSIHPTMVGVLTVNP